MNEKQLNRPPIYTLVVETVGWTLDRTADIPKSQRFTFGQRLDNLMLDALQSAVKAIFASTAKRKMEFPDDLMLSLEQAQALWRLAHDRRWISQQQLIFIGGVSPKAGTMREMRGGPSLPRQSQEASLTAAPVPAGTTGKDAARAVAGNSAIAKRKSRPAFHPPHE